MGYCTSLPGVLGSMGRSNGSGCGMVPHYKKEKKKKDLYLIILTVTNHICQVEYEMHWKLKVSKVCVLRCA